MWGSCLLMLKIVNQKWLRPLLNMFIYFRTKFIWCQKIPKNNLLKKALKFAPNNNLMAKNSQAKNTTFPVIVQESLTTRKLSGCFFRFEKATQFKHFILTSYASYSHTKHCPQYLISAMQAALHNGMKMCIY